MTIQIIRGAKISPPRIIIYGEDKIGKSTFGAGAETPLFIPTEDGVDELGPDRFPLCAKLDEVLDGLSCAAMDRDHATVVLDNLSGLERLVHAAVCKQYNVETIEEVLKGYGKGYGIANDVWAEEVIPRLDACRDAGKVVICIAHSVVRRFDSPETEPYDQHVIDLHKSTSGLLRKWADVIGFATKRVSVVETDVGFKKMVRRGTNVGDKRVLHLVGGPAYAAGNRYGLPATIDLSWSAFVEAMENRVPKSTGGG